MITVFMKKYLLVILLMLSPIVTSAEYFLMRGESAVAKLSFHIPLQTWFLYWYDSEETEEVTDVSLSIGRVNFTRDDEQVSYPYRLRQWSVCTPLLGVEASGS